MVAKVKKAAWEQNIKRASDVGMWEGAKPFLAESGLVCSANAAVLCMGAGGKCPHCWAGGPWLQGSEGPPVVRFGETTGWRSVNIAVNSSSQSPWLPAGVYLKIPDVKVTEHFVGLMSSTSRCQSSGKLMYSDEMGPTGIGWKNPPSYHTVVFLSTLVL